MSNWVMDMIRHILRPPDPPMSVEQVLVAERQRRIAERQRAIDIQIDVLRADRVDAKRRS